MLYNILTIIILSCYMLFLCVYHVISTMYTQCGVSLSDYICHYLSFSYNTQISLISQIGPKWCFRYSSFILTSHDFVLPTHAAKVMLDIMHQGLPLKITPHRLEMALFWNWGLWWSHPEYFLFSKKHIVRPIGTLHPYSSTVVWLGLWSLLCINRILVVAIIQCSVMCIFDKTVLRSIGLSASSWSAATYKNSCPMTDPRPVVLSDDVLKCWCRVCDIATACTRCFVVHASRNLQSMKGLFFANKKYISKIVLCIKTTTSHI
jgi:hypothetical protein